MNLFEKYIPLFSKAWKEKYHAIFEAEHLNALHDNIQNFQHKISDWKFPYFNEEIKNDREKSFDLFVSILNSEEPDEIKVQKLEKICFGHWLNILGQRVTSASIRNEKAIPPPRKVLIEACQKSFNEEITIAQRAWEKHVGRMEDQFWGEVKGNNRQKKEKVMAKINFILDNKTWWNVFFHYKHELVFEVREKGGHGIRWSHGGKHLIGFLEVFINE